MVLRKLVGVFTITLIVCGASIAAAGIVDLEESTATAATGGTLSLFCLPSGLGSPFADGYVYGGTGGAGSLVVAADCTVTLTLRDTDAVAIPNFPFEDVWLQWQDETNLFVCDGGTTCDFNSNEFGVTIWQNGLQIGGWSDSLADVMINGDALTSGTVALSINSADLNVDGIVNLVDVGRFSTAFAAPVVDYSADFANDGRMLVSDVSKMAQGVGAACP
jgi:hypothetical protein